MTAWMYFGKIFTDEMIDDHVGFVYEIENLHNGKKYIGKKLFRFKKKKVRKHKRNVKYTVESDWKEYWGSNKGLLTDIIKHGKDHFKRTILKLCKSKGTCNYFETKLIMEFDAIIRDDYYNEWLSIKINRSQIKQ